MRDLLNRWMTLAENFTKALELISNDRDRLANENKRLEQELRDHFRAEANFYGFKYPDDCWHENGIPDGKSVIKALVERHDYLEAALQEMKARVCGLEFTGSWVPDFVDTVLAIQPIWNRKCPRCFTQWSPALSSHGNPNNCPQCESVFSNTINAIRKELERVHADWHQCRVEGHVCDACHEMVDAAIQRLTTEVKP